MRRAIAVFGPARCMVATHLPVDGLLWTAEELVDTLLAIVVDLTADERRDFFSGCARRQYGLS